MKTQKLNKIMSALTDRLENWDCERLNHRKLCRILFDEIGFPADATEFLANYYPTSWVTAYEQIRYGIYSQNFVAVVHDYSELDDIADDFHCTVEELGERFGLVVEDESFDGIIAIING